MIKVNSNQHLLQEDRSFTSVQVEGEIDMSNSDWYMNWFLSSLPFLVPVMAVIAILAHIVFSVEYPKWSSTERLFNSVGTGVALGTAGALDLKGISILTQPGFIMTTTWSMVLIGFVVAMIVSYSVLTHRTTWKIPLRLLLAVLIGTLGSVLVGSLIAAALMIVAVIFLIGLLAAGSVEYVVFVFIRRGRW